MAEDEIIETYEVPAIIGSATVRIIKRGGKKMYRFVEPEYTLEDEFRSMDIIRSGKAPSYLDYQGNDISQKSGISPGTYYLLNRDIRGSGKIDILLRDSYIEDISCEGPDQPVQVFLRKYGYIPTEVAFNSVDLDNFIRRTVQATGKQISSAIPMVDATLPDGSRLHAFLGEYVSTKGSSFTIRRFREKPLSFMDMIDLGTADEDIMSYLWLAIEFGSNVMVIGGTASGKTSFLNSILQFIPKNRKLITIEDTREIKILHENWLQMVTRSGTPGTGGSVGSSEINMFTLLEASLRHRPNYLVVGEVRGRESYTVFQAMSAGRYALATFHAEDFESFVHRMESKPISIPRQIISSLDLVILVRAVSTRDGVVRKVVDISEIMGVEPSSDEVTTNALYVLQGDEYQYSGSSYVMESIGFREGLSQDELSKKLRDRRLLIRKLKEKGIRDYNALSGIVSKMEKEPETVLKEFEIS